ncbi:para-aminobenzoate synthase [Venturia nashicola]|nr:para-aminobenzoate synthase [Venturia nashicola]
MINPQILYVDAYDSFSNNIIDLLRTSIDADVHCVKIDDFDIFEHEDENSLGSFLSHFDAVVVGPGPGHPTQKKDIGWVDDIWNLSDSHLLPVFGICLGFQSLCNAFGGEVLRLTEPRHGLVLRVDHNSQSVFKGLNPFNGTMYHSLHVDIGHVLTTGDLWKPSRLCPELVPTAWDLQDAANGPVLMGVRHATKPFCGVQFHPESVVTGATIAQGNIEFLPIGASLVINWWQDAQRWNSVKGRRIESWNFSATGITKSLDLQKPDRESQTNQQRKMWDALGIYGKEVAWNARSLSRTTVQQICQMLQVNRDEGVLLESGVRCDGSPLVRDIGRYSIIGLVDEDTVRLQYFDTSSRIVLYAQGHEITCEGTVSDFWNYLKRLQEQMRCTNGSDRIPFWGGFMGFVSYEAGLAGINVTADKLENEKSRPDISFVLVLRSVVVDHETRLSYVQSIKNSDEEWVFNTSAAISRFDDAHEYESPAEELLDPASRVCSIGTPDSRSYMQKVGQCDKAIRAGDSYELCLTNQVKIKVSKQEEAKHESSWDLYQKLSERNTAPFAAYINLNHGNENLNIIGSSPERFMSWSRNGKCQFRPIKGTVKKMPGMTVKDACQILRPSLNSKDVAENLMITDLVRHDLNGIVERGSVHVSKLFGVEEYKTVFQLVSVIEGQLPRSPKPSEKPGKPALSYSAHCQDTRANSGLATPDSLPETPSSPASYSIDTVRQRELPTGIDALAASLPPGSMTGAPKKRSCEILQDIEDHVPRGIYSGVIGYLDVGGGGDFSVVIRTAWKWSGDDIIDEELGKCEVWRAGAGGAVTSQSTPEGETEEMLTKLASFTAAFG